jgi:hypothetical protein
MSAEFAHGKVDPHDAGKMGGQTGGTGNSDTDGVSSGNSNQGSAKGGSYLSIYMLHLQVAYMPLQNSPMERLTQSRLAEREVKLPE